MLAMLRKDCYVMGKYTVMLLVFWMIMAGMYSLVPGVDKAIFYGIMPAMASTVVLNAVSSDQICRWDAFAAMTPLRPWQLVLEKYLFACGALVLMAGLGELVRRVSVRKSGSVHVGTVMVLVSLVIAMGLPLVYRFGRHRGSTILLSVWGAAAAVILGTAHWRRDLLGRAFDWIEEIPLRALAAGTAAAVFVINAGSILLSVRFYTRRQRGLYD